MNCAPGTFLKFHDFQICFSTPLPCQTCLKFQRLYELTPRKTRLRIHREQEQFMKCGLCNMAQIDLWYRQEDATPNVSIENIATCSRLSNPNKMFTLIIHHSHVLPPSVWWRYRKTKLCHMLGSFEISEVSPIRFIAWQRGCLKYWMWWLSYANTMEMDIAGQDHHDPNKAVDWLRDNADIGD